jgi:hypothetical protein
MKPAPFLLSLAAATLVSSPASPQEKAPEPTDRVKELQKLRIETLRQATEIGLKLYQSGRIEVGQVLDDRITLLKAEVEAAPKADHIPLYTQAVASLKQFEDIAKSQHEAGRGTEYSLLRVRSKRLEVEVLLEKAKGAKAGKDASWSEPADGVRARLTSAKARYRVGEALRLTLELEEPGGRARSLDAPRFLPMISYPGSHPYGADHGFP